MKRVWPFVKRLYIRDKSLQVRRLADCATAPQLRLVAEVERVMEQRKPVRVIILKARQMGFSTMVEAMQMQAAFALPGLNGLVLAHENKSSEHLLKMTKHYWDTAWFREAYETRFSGRKHLGWDNGSEITIATAENRDSGRGSTIHYLHASEAGLYPDGGDLMGGLLQTVPMSNPLSFVFVESTAKGIGNWFHQTWLEAEAGENGFVPVFFGWWEHPDYHAHAIGMGDKAEKPLPTKDEEEQAMWRFLASKAMDDSEIKSRLIWRRHMISTQCSGNLDVWHSEYPHTPEVAFVSTGRNVFAAHHLAKLYEPISPHRGSLRWAGNQVKFSADPYGELFIYAAPSKRRDYGQYMIGADCSRVAGRGDYAVAQVINRVTMEQVAVYRSRSVDQVRFADELVKLAEFYNHAMLAPENNYAQSVIGALQVKYDNLFLHRKVNRVRGQLSDVVGWTTNSSTKAEAVGNLASLVVSTAENMDMHLFRLRDHQTYMEMRHFVTTDNHGFTNASAVDHDDTVMALAIGVSATLYERQALNVDQGFAEAKWSTAPPPDPIVQESQDRMRDAGASFAPDMVDQGDGRWGMSQPGPDDQWLFQSEQPDMYEESEW